MLDSGFESSVIGQRYDSLHLRHVDGPKTSSKNDGEDEPAANQPRGQSPPRLGRSGGVLHRLIALRWCHWCDESVTAPGKCFDVNGVLGRIAQDLAQFVDGLV